MTKLKDSIPPIHPEGYIFILIAVACTFLSAAFSAVLGWLFGFVTIFVTCFFRDPKRVAPIGEDLVISPADGVVQKIEDAIAPEELGLGKKTFKRISVFLSVFNVHVNRVPVSGKITKLHYRPGKFLNAANEKASSDNERQTCLAETKKGEQIVFVQIAGLIAKRIICDLNEGDDVKGGEKFGLIRFGSRMDIYLPKDAKISISEGQTMIRGETILAELSGKEVSSPKETKKVAAASKASSVKKVAVKKAPVKKEAPKKEAEKKSATKKKTVKK